MITFFLVAEPVADYAAAKKSGTRRLAAFFHWLLERGIYWPASQFGAAFVSAAHSAEDIARTAAAIGGVLRAGLGRVMWSLAAPRRPGNGPGARGLAV